VRFGWESPQVWDKVQEELQELQVEVGNQDNIEAEDLAMLIFND
jgi:hypothetical protein